MVKVDPTGIESRSPTGRSAEAIHTRASPWRRKICALSFVESLSAVKIGPATARRRSSPAATASSLKRGPVQTGPGYRGQPCDETPKPGPSDALLGEPNPSPQRDRLKTPGQLPTR